MLVDVPENEQICKWFVIQTGDRKLDALSSKDGVKRLFVITPEGDGKMKLHISLALTTRADGES